VSGITDAAIDAIVVGVFWESMTTYFEIFNFLKDIQQDLMNKKALLFIVREDYRYLQHYFF